MRELFPCTIQGTTPFFFFCTVDLQELVPTWLQGISSAPPFSKESLHAQQRDIPIQCCTTLGFIRKHTALRPTLASFFSINLGLGKMPNVKVSLHSPSTRWRKSIVAFSGPVRNAALKMLHYILPLLLFQRRNLHVTFKLHIMGYIGLSSTLILLMEDGNPLYF